MTSISWEQYYTTNSYKLSNIDELDKITQMKGIPKLPKTTFKIEYNVDSGGKPKVPDTKTATIVNHRLLIENPTVMELTIQADSLWDYQSGDSFGVVCENNEVLVNKILERLGVDSNSSISISDTEDKLPKLLQQPMSIHDLFTSILDLHTFPKKPFFRMLAESCSSQTEKKTLYFLSCSLGTSTYKDLKQQFPTLLDILNLFPSCEPKLEDLVQNCPILSPRYYSISKSNHISKPNQLSFTFNVIESDKSKDHKFKGLCSNYLFDAATISSLKNIDIFPRIAPIKFHLDGNAENLVFICNGTGLAPFIGFLQDIEYNKLEKNVVLVYGHRTKSDKLFQPELLHFQEANICTIIECLSQDSNATYKYVQHSLSFIDNLMESSIYVCGSGEMGKGVDDALLQMKIKTDQCTLKESVEFWNEKTLKGTYVRELW